MGVCGEMCRSIFYLILCEKNFLGLGAPACLLDLGVYCFDALAVDVRGLGGFGDVHRWILLHGFCGELNVNHREN